MKFPFLNKKVQESPNDTLRNAEQGRTGQSFYEGLLGSGARGVLHDVYKDYGYPEDPSFTDFITLYKRLGIAKNVVELIPDRGWMTVPEVEGSSQFTTQLEAVIKRTKLWMRCKGLDIRQRVGRYAGLFMRVRDGNVQDQPLLPGPGLQEYLVSITPLYEGELKVLSTDTDPMSESFGQPAMFQYKGGMENSSSSFSIHPSRIIIAAEGSDNGTLNGVSSLEAPYNSLLDIQKIIGAGGEGFYKNSAQSIIFELKDGAKSTISISLLDNLSEKLDDFVKNRFTRALWVPGLSPHVIEAKLTDPTAFFNSAINDVAAATKIPATIIMGQQTGRLASSEDMDEHLSMIQSRRENFMTELVSDILNWMIEAGILPMSDFELQWDDLLALSDKDRLENAALMSSINGLEGDIFSSSEIRDVAGYANEE